MESTGATALLQSTFGEEKHTSFLVQKIPPALQGDVSAKEQSPQTGSGEFARTLCCQECVSALDVVAMH